MTTRTRTSHTTALHTTRTLTAQQHRAHGDIEIPRSTLIRCATIVPAHGAPIVIYGVRDLPLFNNAVRHQRWIIALSPPRCTHLIDGVPCQIQTSALYSYDTCCPETPRLCPQHHRARMMNDPSDKYYSGTISHALNRALSILFTRPPKRDDRETGLLLQHINYMFGLDLTRGAMLDPNSRACMIARANMSGPAFIACYDRSANYAYTVKRTFMQIRRATH
jgi:hypothetical protein